MWLTFLFQMLQGVPYIVAGIEKIHGDAKSGVDKKSLAMESLGLATAVSTAVVPPEQQAAAQAAAALASSAIDGTVAVFNATGMFGRKPVAPAQP